MSSRHSLDSLGDRLKTYERLSTSQTFIPNLPIYIRLDGRSFSKFTKGLERPYDENFSKLMIETTKFLVKELDATIGYTQSDEISLVLKNQYGKGCIFNGRVDKLLSISAGLASAYFNKHLTKYLPSKTEEVPVFDSRAFNVPNEDEAANCILWREQDATKNSIQMAGHHYFSHKELHQKNTKTIREMLLKKEVVWEDYPNHFKYGTYVQRELFDVDTATRSRVSIIDWFNSLKEFEHPGRVQIVMNSYPEETDDANDT